MKTPFYKFLDKRWHLHFLTFPLSIILIYFGQKGFISLNEVPYWFIVFLTTFLSFGLGFLVEAYESVHYHTVETPETAKASNYDMLACGVGGFLAGLVGGNLLVAGIAVMLIGGLELIREEK